MENNYRLYGNPPYGVVLIHGGPGAAGSLSKIALEIDNYCGVIEVLESKETFLEQIEEIALIINHMAHKPITLIGHSWGAFLSLVYCSKYPYNIKKILLIGCGALEHQYVQKIQKTRTERISKEKNNQLNHLLYQLNSANNQEKDEIFKQFGKFYEEIDSYSPIYEVENPDFPVFYSYQIYDNAWRSFEQLRNSGKLIDIIKNLTNDIVLIHGNYDPHPIEGIEVPLRRIGVNFRTYFLENCGHSPWIEKFAKQKFFEILKKEILNITSF